MFRIYCKPLSEGNSISWEGDIYLPKMRITIQKSGRGATQRTTNREVVHPILILNTNRFIILNTNLFLILNINLILILNSNVTLNLKKITNYNYHF